MQFTSHNIELPDGKHTKPDVRLLAETGVCQAALRDLEFAFPGDNYPGDNGDVSVADLGCLEGGYAVEFARAGYTVTGIEARSDNMACCEFVAHALNLPNLSFIQGDVRDIVEGKVWDVVFCCGLLYHLDDPVRFLSQLGRATRKMLILQTHYSVNPLFEHEGYRGHWYVEPVSRWSSHGNCKSFWLSKTELLDAIHAAGFPLVFEQADYRTSIRSETYTDQHGSVEQDRGMFVGIKL